MRAMQVQKANGEFVLVQREVPSPARGQVRIRVQACGICHSDAFVRSGAFPGLRLPRVPGHEVAGVVDALGEGVHSLAPGQRVGVGWHGGHCFTCDMCRRGAFLNCRSTKITGISHDGGYADYMLAPWESVARLPDEVSAVDAGPLLCAGVTTYNSLRNSGARPGDVVAIQGIGGLGHLALQYARQMGFRTVALSRGKDKEALARELGAHHYVDADSEDVVRSLQALGGASVILATAPNNAAISGVVEGLAPRGKLMIVAAPHEPLQVSAFSLLSGRTIHGWPSGTSIDSEDTLRFSALSGVRPRVETYALEEANQAFDRMISNRARFRVVLTME